jgi:hypothetical protein
MSELHKLRLLKSNTMDTELHEALAGIMSRLDKIETHLSDPHVGVLPVLHDHIGDTTERANTLQVDLAKHIADDALVNAKIASELIATNTKILATDAKIDNILGTIKHITRNPLFIAIVVVIVTTIFHSPDAGKYLIKALIPGTQVSAQVQGRGQ